MSNLSNNWLRTCRLRAGKSGLIGKTLRRAVLDLPMTSKRGLEGADAFIAVLTPDYLASPYCVDLELHYAVQLNKKIIPIVLKTFDTTPPDGIGHINWIYFTPHAGHDNLYDESYPKVIAALEQDLQHARTHKRLGLRAMEWDRQKRADSFLLSGDELKQAEHWLTESLDKTPVPTDLHVAYIAQSRAFADKRQRQLLAAVSGALVVSILLTVLSVVFFVQARANEREAELNENIALTAQAEAIVNLNAAATSAVEADFARATAVAEQQIAVVERERAEENAQLSRALVLSIESLNSVDSDQIKAISLALQSVAGNLLPDGIRRSVASVVYMPGPSHLHTFPDRIPVQAITADGRLAVIAEPLEDDFADLFDLESGEIVEQMVLPDGVVTTVATDVESEYVAIGSDTGSVSVWEISSGDIVQTFTIDPDIPITALAFAYDKKHLAAGDEGGGVAVWDVLSGDEVAFWLAADDIIKSLDFSHDGRLLGVASLSGATLWDVRAQSLEQELPVEEVAALIRFAPDNQLVAVGETQTLSMFALRGGRSRGRISFDDVIADARFHGGNRLAVGTLDRRIELFNIETGKPEIRLAGHEEGITVLRFIDRDRLYSGAWDGTVIEWDLQDGRKLIGTSEQVFSSFLPNGREVASVTTDGHLMIRDVIDDTVVDDIRGDDLDDLSDDVDYVAAIDDSTLAVMTFGGEVGLWNIESRSFDTVYAVHDDAIDVFALSEDKQFILSATWDNTVRFWNVQTGEVIQDLPVEGQVFDLALSPDATIAMTLSEADNIPRFWDLSTGEPMTLLQESLDDEIYDQVIFSQDGQRIFLARGDFRIDVVDIASDEVVQELVGALDRVMSMDISSDGNSLVAGGFDRHVRVWDVESGEMVRAFDVEDFTDHVEISPDGNKALSNASDRLDVWRIDTLDELVDWAKANRFVRDLTCDELVRYNLDVAGCD